MIERIVDAPVDLVWQMWTDPEHFSRGTDPAARPSRSRRWTCASAAPALVCMEMQTPNGPMQMWFTGEYREVVENERLVYTESMSDEHGNVSSPRRGSPRHPTTEVAVELEDVGGRTKMVMTHAGIPADSPGAAGWTMALDKLDAYISTARKVEQRPSNSAGDDATRECADSLSWVERRGQCRLLFGSW